MRNELINIHNILYIHTRIHLYIYTSIYIHIPSIKHTYHLIMLNLDCKYIFTIDLTPNGIKFGAKTIRKLELESKFDSTNRIP